MQADIDKVLHVRLEGPLTQLLTKVDPELYTKCLSKENRKDIMYVQLAKALHGTLQAAMLFWKDLTGYLLMLGFILNPYNNCVANKIIDSTQCTTLWHVDDLKITHIKQEVIEDLVQVLNERYGKLDPLTVTHGDIHNYLGMTLDYSVPGQVSIQMDDYVQYLLEEAPANMQGTMTTPAADHLFSIYPEPKYLDKAESEFFHHMTAKLLFLCKCATGYPDCCGLPNNMGEATGQGRLQEARTSRQISAGSSSVGPNTGGRRRTHREMVGGCFLCCAS
jgi:hypothetical protein